MYPLDPADVEPEWEGPAGAGTKECPRYTSWWVPGKDGLAQASLGTDNFHWNHPDGLNPWYATMFMSGYLYRQKTQATYYRLTAVSSTYSC